MDVLDWFLRRWYTLRPLRWEQWWFRLWHPVKKIFWLPKEMPDEALEAALKFPKADTSALAVSHKLSPATRTFTFLNLEQTFGTQIDWNYQGKGLLWNYHLNYLDGLEEETLPVHERVDMLQDFARQYDGITQGRASYPASRRLINCIRFLGVHPCTDRSVHQFMYRDALRIAAFPERHLLGNHFWENAFALFAAGLFFQDKKIAAKAEQWMLRNLHEQVLNDGGHVEQSPSYHVLMLQRLLQCLQLQQANAAGSFYSLPLIEKMKIAAGAMLGWLMQMKFSNGEVPGFNDVAPERLPTMERLLEVADKLSIIPELRPLGDSGFRKMKAGIFEAIVDVGNVQAAYQPGHSHADALGFCLQANGNNIVVDTGTSTYEPTRMRLEERGTSAHNTVSVNGKNSSDVWKSFRLGRRSKVKIMTTDDDHIVAVCKLARDYKTRLTRNFGCNNKSFTILDEVTESNTISKMFLHFSPDERIKQIEKNFFLYRGIFIRIDGADAIYLRAGKTGNGFNSQQLVDVLEATFHQKITTSFESEHSLC